MEFELWVVEAVTDANVVAEDGEVTVFVGPSGCGKTILISTHVFNLAKLADKSHYMKDGRIINSSTG